MRDIGNHKRQSVWKHVYIHGQNFVQKHAQASEVGNISFGGSSSNFYGGAVIGTDRSILNLMIAMRKQESDNDYHARGKSGEIGAYQFTPGCWYATAPKCGIFCSLESASRQQQDIAVYRWIKERKDLGYTPKEIASMWNAGDGEPNAYTGVFHSTTNSHRAGQPSRGINRDGAYYDVATYSQRVVATYNKLKQKYPS